jgi:hypothetical protein
MVLIFLWFQWWGSVVDAPIGESKANQSKVVLEKFGAVINNLTSSDQ